MLNIDPIKTLSVCTPEHSGLVFFPGNSTISRLLEVIRLKCQDDTTKFEFYCNVSKIFNSAATLTLKVINITAQAVPKSIYPVCEDINNTVT